MGLKGYLPGSKDHLPQQLVVNMQQIFQELSLQHIINLLPE